MTSADVTPPHDAPTHRPRWSVAAVVGTYLVVGLVWIVALFEAFRQGTRAVAEPNPGTGMGLALVREFAEIHGGTAWYEPREPHGARFMVRLPVG